jgi:arginine N-succinyltransferase
LFLMRRAKIEDAATLLKLAKMVHFINLPADKDIINEKVRWSQRCFQEVAAGQGVGLDAKAAARSRRGSAGALGGGGGDDGLTKLLGDSKLFMFVLEDTESGGVLGTSQIITNMGGPGHPNLSFELSRKEMFSTSLQMGTTHIVAKLKLDESGPTEIGGLILQPSYRGHKAKLGRFLSWVRFHFMGMYRPVFADRVLAELMGPITPDGQSTLWEYLGRRFINLTYIEADRFCQHSKEFMLSLLPREEIYLTLLPPEARRLVAQVGPETEPAKKMLERLGFEYRNCIDPFDGGPNLEAMTDEITLVRHTRRATVGEPIEADGKVHALVSTLDKDGEFVALQALCETDGKQGVRLTREQMSALRVEPGAVVGMTPSSEVSRPAPKTKGGKAAAAENGRGTGKNGTSAVKPAQRVKEGA